MAGLAVGMTALAIDLGAEDSHDFDQVLAEPLLRVDLLLLLEDDNLSAHGLADTENNLGSEAEEPVLVAKTKVFTFPANSKVSNWRKPRFW